MIVLAKHVSPKMGQELKMLLPPDGDVRVHLLEVVPDHHRGVLLVVQPSDDQSAGYDTTVKFQRKSSFTNLL